jgi:FixJ family two-component response regulator
MNGQKLYELLAPNHPEMKVLYMSGYTDNIINQHDILSEGAAFLQKPFTIENLLDKVRTILG